MTNQKALDALKHHFGYAAFRPMQAEIIESIYHKKDALVLMPTGGGKSICFQIPALTLPGTTLVISPLISLMKDQVEALKDNGIAAAYINSSMNYAEQVAVENRLLNGELKLIYVSPEKAVSEGFFPIVQQLNLSLIAIDEAHCISSWGHDFRPEYTKLKFLRKQFAEIPIIALTATADKVTRTDIKAQLGIPEAPSFVASFDRPNLHLEVRPGQRKIDQILEFVQSRPGQSGIVYCISRKSTEQTALRLQEKGIKADYYHAGMDPLKRNKVQEEFINDRIPIVCATIAFGMGIDKSNVRWVIHFNLPQSLENYYQEIGRAGRDGLPSDTLLFYSMQDIATYHFLFGNEENKNKELKMAKLDRMLAYAQSFLCRRKILLNYFNEKREEDCGHCDVCKNPPKFYEGTVDAQKALSAALRTGERAAQGMLVDVLRGSNKQEIRRAGYDKIKTFGAGADLSAFDWTFLLQQMIQLGLFEVDYHKFLRLKVTESGKEVLFGKRNVQLVRPNNLKEKLQAREKKEKKKSSTFRADQLLLKELKKLRKKLAQQKGIPPYIVFTDASLEEMAQDKPSTLDAFSLINGVGVKKLETYGDLFLQAIANYKKHAGGSADNLPASHEYTFELFKAGKEIATIAKERGMAEGTIGGHLVQSYLEGADFNVWDHITEQDVQIIADLLPQLESPVKLVSISRALDGNMDYFKIKLCMAYLEKRNMSATARESATKS